MLSPARGSPQSIGWSACGQRGQVTWPGSAAAEVLWFPDYKAGRASSPIWARAAGATASHWDERQGNYCPPTHLTGKSVSGLLWVQCFRVTVLKHREKKNLTPLKRSSEEATSTGVSSSNEEPLWLPNVENGCHAWRASHRMTTTNQIGGIKKRRGEVATCWWAAGKKLQRNKSLWDIFWIKTGASESEESERKSLFLKNGFLHKVQKIILQFILQIIADKVPLQEKKEMCSCPSICLVKILNVVECQVDNKEPHKVSSKHTLTGVNLHWGFLLGALVAEAAGCDRITGIEGRGNISSFFKNLKTARKE